MTKPAHEWMLELVHVAEELGYLVLAVKPGEVTLTRPTIGGFVDVTIMYDPQPLGALLRSVLVPVEPDGR